jgi:hypothetical protein
MDVDSSSNGAEPVTRSPSVTATMSQMDLDDDEMEGLYGPPAEHTPEPVATKAPSPMSLCSQRPPLPPRLPSQMPHLDLVLKNMGGPWPGKFIEGTSKRSRKLQAKSLATTENTKDGKLVNFTRSSVQANLLAMVGNG